MLNCFHSDSDSSDLHTKCSALPFLQILSLYGTILIINTAPYFICELCTDFFFPQTNIAVISLQNDTLKIVRLLDERDIEAAGLHWLAVQKMTDLV